MSFREYTFGLHHHEIRHRYLPRSPVCSIKFDGLKIETVTSTFNLCSSLFKAPFILPLIARRMASSVPPMTSTLEMIVSFCRPRNPSKLDVTLKLIGSSVSCPMLRFAIALAWPMRRNSEDLEEKKCQEVLKRSKTACELLTLGRSTPCLPTR